MNNQRGYRVKRKSRKEIRSISEQLHKQFCFDNYPVPIVEIVDVAMTKLNENYQFEVIEKSILGDRHGYSVPNEAKIVIREDVYDRAAMGVARDCETLAHELGHYVLHFRCNDHFNFAPTGEPLVPQENSEWQADNFVYEFLAPVAIVRSVNDPVKLAKVCGITQMTAAMRYHILRAEGILFK